MAHTLAPELLSCGHLSTPPTSGCGAAGYATRPDGTRICYTCADASERESLKTARAFTAYLSNGAHSTPTGYHLTTWTGGILANVTTLTRGNHNIGGFLYRFRAVDVHGQKWYGTSPGPGMYARMRRAK